MAHEQQTRFTYSGEECLIHELAMVGWSSHSRARARALGPHTHEDAYEVCFLVQGSVDWWVENQVIELKRGELYITRPAEPHGGLDAVFHPCELYWVQVRFPREAVLPGLSLEETRSLEGALANIQERSFGGSPVVKELFERIVAEHRAPTIHSALMVRSTLQALLVYVLRDYDAHVRRLVADRAQLSPRIGQSLAWINERLGESFAVEEAARVADMSVSHFHERFLREVGFTPGDYRLRQRIRKAKQLLREGDLTVTQIAFALGFSTSQYFATAFKNLTGTTPKNYRSMSYSSHAESA